MSKKQRQEAKRRRKKRGRRAQGRRDSEDDVRHVDMDIHREIRYITERAQAGDARLVTLGNLVLFSTETQDAWLLDSEDGFVLCLARGGEPQRYRILDTADTFAIEWNARFEITGAVFVVTGRSGEVRSIYGYPTAQIADACARYQ